MMVRGIHTHPPYVCWNLFFCTLRSALATDHFIKDKMQWNGLDETNFWFKNDAGKYDQERA